MPVLSRDKAGSRRGTVPPAVQGSPRSRSGEFHRGEGSSPAPAPPAPPKQPRKPVIPGGRPLRSALLRPARLRAAGRTLAAARPLHSALRGAPRAVSLPPTHGQLLPLAARPAPLHRARLRRSPRGGGGPAPGPGRGSTTSRRVPRAAARPKWRFLPGAARSLRLRRRSRSSGWGERRCAAAGPDSHPCPGAAPAHDHWSLKLRGMK